MINNTEDFLITPKDKKPIKDFIGTKDSQATISEWTDERANLLSIMEKNEKIINITQNALMKDKQNMIKEFKSTENLFKTQINTLNEENTAYKAEIDRLNGKLEMLQNKNEKLIEELNKAKIFVETSKTNTQEFVSKNEQLHQKLQKIEYQSKQREEKLKQDLLASQNQSKTLESEFLNKIEELSKKIVSPAKSNSRIPENQLQALLAQKKDIEKVFIQEKNGLTREIEKYLKTIKELKKRIEQEKNAWESMENSYKNDIKILFDDLETANKEIKRLEQEIEYKDKMYTTEILDVNMKSEEREKEISMILEELQGELKVYKDSIEKKFEKKENSFKNKEIYEYIRKKYKKIKCLSGQTNNFIAELISFLNSSVSAPETLIQIPQKPVQISAESLNIIKTLKTSIESKLKTLEKQQQTLENYFEEHSSELISKEKNNIQEIIKISNENMELNSKLSVLQCMRSEYLTYLRALTTSKEKLPEIDNEMNTVNQELVAQNTKLLKKISKKTLSLKTKQNSELDAWILRENLYKKSLKALKDQISLLFTQIQELEKVKDIQTEFIKGQNTELLQEIAFKTEEITNIKTTKFQAEERMKEKERYFEECVTKLQKMECEVFQCFEESLKLVILPESNES
ncbi:hypothetical protein SteCoe_21841 [Stentor coeruleus]|uniref:Uncharacterized protein n=1 Tax=Stentor coeruleus TaxID=5963 RepID=A0A1R2BNG6_9CILI|nr:hypothetical protein SteCoe_21841 [Stentor coeruleus]